MQFAGRERRRGVAAALFLIDRADDPVRFLQCDSNLLGVLAVVDFNLLFALAQEPRVKRGRLAGSEVRVDRPVLNFLERLDFAFTLNDQAESDGLHTSGGKAAADFIP